MATRDAYARTKLGELTRDEKAARERRETAELQPGKWVRRGVQPEVAPKPATGFARLMRLASEINDEPDEARKNALEARYKAESAAIADLTNDPNERGMHEVRDEIVLAFAPIVSDESFAMPEVMSREQWLAFHSRLVQCKRHAAGWLSRSRRFAAERWGIDYVAESEAQMELALGIEPKELPASEPIAPEIAMADAIAGKVAKLAKGGDPATWPRESLLKAAASLAPVLEFVNRVIVAGREASNR